MLALKGRSRPRPRPREPRQGGSLVRGWHLPPCPGPGPRICPVHPQEWVLLKQSPWVLVAASFHSPSPTPPPGTWSVTSAPVGGRCLPQGELPESSGSV